MAGSYRHITDHDNKFRGIDLIDHLGDAYEALEECYDMIAFLTNNDKQKIFNAWLKGHVEKRFGKERIKSDPKVFNFNSFWFEDEDEEK